MPELATQADIDHYREQRYARFGRGNAKWDWRTMTGDKLGRTFKLLAGDDYERGKEARPVESARRFAKRYGYRVSVRTDKVADQILVTFKKRASKFDAALSSGAWVACQYGERERALSLASGRGMRCWFRDGEVRFVTKADYAKLVESGAITP